MPRHMPLRPTEEEARTSPIGRNWISARVLPLVQRHRDVTLRRKGSNELVEDISNDQDVAETRSGGQPPIKLISFLIIVAIPFSPASTISSSRRAISTYQKRVLP